MTTPPPDAVALEEAAVGSPLDDTDEEKYLSEARYKRLQQERHSKFKGHVHWASIAALWLGLLFYILAAFVWLYHLISPGSWHFMVDRNFDVLQNLLFGTIVGALVGQFARKIFDD